MARWFRVALWTISLLVPAAALAQGNARFAYVNSERILELYSGTKTAMETFKRDVDGWNQEAQQRKKELDELGRQLEQKTPMLSDEKRRELEQDYQRRLTEYDQYVQNLWGSNGLIGDRNEEILRPIIAKIQGILARIGQDEHYDVILDAADGNLLYGNPDFDLTQRVVDELNGEVGAGNP